MFDAVYAHAFAYIWVKRWFVVYLRWWYHIASATYSLSWNPKAGQEFHTSHSTRISPVDQILDYHAFVLQTLKCRCFGVYSNMDQPCSSIFGLDLSPLCDPRQQRQEFYGCSDPLFTQSFKGRYMPRAVLAGGARKPMVSHGIPWYPMVVWVLLIISELQNMLGTRWLSQVKVPSHSLPPRARQVNRVPWTLLGKQHHSWNNVGWVRLSKAMGDEWRLNWFGVPVLDFTLIFIDVCCGCFAWWIDCG